MNQKYNESIASSESWNNVRDKAERKFWKARERNNSTMDNAQGCAEDAAYELGIVVGDAVTNDLKKVIDLIWRESRCKSVAFWAKSDRAMCLAQFGTRRDESSPAG